MSNEIERIDISKLTKGMYYAKINGESIKVIKKIVKK
ncbi:T9SS type A sorting domain-containing protein [Aquimarina pacifica]